MRTAAEKANVVCAWVLCSHSGVPLFPFHPLRVAGWLLLRTHTHVTSSPSVPLQHKMLRTPRLGAHPPRAAHRPRRRAAPASAAANTFGTAFRVTTFGESHGKGVGCVIDGVPPRLAVSKEEVQAELDRRRPGQSRITTPRKESDTCEIYSGEWSVCVVGSRVGREMGKLGGRTTQEAAAASPSRPNPPPTLHLHEPSQASLPTASPLAPPSASWSPTQTSGAEITLKWTRPIGLPTQTRLTT